MATIIVEGNLTESTIFRDRRVGLFAKGLVALIFTSGKDKVTTQYLAKRVPNTKGQIYEAVQELRNLGYAKRFRDSGTNKVSYRLSCTSDTCPRYGHHTQYNEQCGLSEREEVLFSFREQDRIARYTREEIPKADPEVEDWDSIDPASAVSSAVQPPLIPKLHATRAKPIIESIPIEHHKILIRICFMAETDAEALLVGSANRSRIANALGQLREARVDLNQLHHFELWWSESWRSRDKFSKAYQPPRPEQVVEFWSIAMKSYQPRVKPEVAPKPESNIIDFNVMEAMQRRAASRKGQ